VLTAKFVVPTKCVNVLFVAVILAVGVPDIGNFISETIACPCVPDPGT